jgi:hypothetical protein
VQGAQTILPHEALDPVLTAGFTGLSQVQKHARCDRRCRDWRQRRLESSAKASRPLWHDSKLDSEASRSSRLAQPQAPGTLSGQEIPVDALQ